MMALCMHTHTLFLYTEIQVYMHAVINAIPRSLARNPESLALKSYPTLPMRLEPRGSVAFIENKLYSAGSHRGKPF